MIDMVKRVAIIYDHAIHKKPVKQIIQDHNLNYSTVRHILLQYFLFGRTDIRKFRQVKNDSKPLTDQNEDLNGFEKIANRTRLDVSIPNTQNTKT